MMGLKVRDCCEDEDSAWCWRKSEIEDAGMVRMQDSWSVVFGFWQLKWAATKEKLLWLVSLLRMGRNAVPEFMIRPETSGCLYQM